MRERLLTLLLALGALLVFGTLFVRGGGGTSALARPTSSESRGNGLLGLRTWLQQEGIRTLSLRERFLSLAKHHELPASGNLLIVTLPVVIAFRTNEAVALDDWIRHGNTLLVLAPLADRPDWAEVGVALQGDVRLLTGLNIEIVTEGDATPPRRDDAAAEAQKPAAGSKPRVDDEEIRRMLAAMRRLEKPLRQRLVPNREHPYLHAVREAVAFSDYPPRAWRAALPREAFFFVLAHQGGTQEAALWMRPDGSGTIIVSGFASLLSNRALGEADNARLIANLIASSVSPTGHVIFDDEHQGLTAAYDPAKFYRDPRLYATLAIIGAVWLVWVVGGTRLRMPAPRSAAPREAELVRATGAFLARVVRPGAAARRMYESFFSRLNTSANGDADALASRWDWLENNPRLSRADVAQLREWYAEAYSDRAVPLERLHNLILRTERQLAP